jgi:ubiquinol-cytochrome c reductase cytochrome c subunit
MTTTCNRASIRTALLACGLATLAAAANAQANAADIERGRQLFMHNGCYSCHGTVGQGGERSAGPRIAPEPFPLEVFKVIVRNGKEGMPRFDARFVSDEQLQDIHQYLASIPKGRGAKDIPLLQVQP